MSPDEPRPSTLRRSRSPQDRRHHRERSRSPRSHHHHHHHHHVSHKHKRPKPSSAPPPPPPQQLPLQASKLHRRDLEAYRPMFELYLDIQKQKVLEELSESEVRGRWKSFVGKWCVFLLPPTGICSLWDLGSTSTTATTIARFTRGC